MLTHYCTPNKICHNEAALLPYSISNELKIPKAILKSQLWFEILNIKIECLADLEHLLEYSTLLNSKSNIIVKVLTSIVLNHCVVIGSYCYHLKQIFFLLSDEIPEFDKISNIYCQKRSRIKQSHQNQLTINSRKLLVKRNFHLHRSSDLVPYHLHTSLCLEKSAT